MRYIPSIWEKILLSFPIRTIFYAMSVLCVAVKVFTWQFSKRQKRAFIVALLQNQCNSNYSSISSAYDEGPVHGHPNILNFSFSLSQSFYDE